MITQFTFEKQTIRPIGLVYTLVFKMTNEIKLDSSCTLFLFLG